MDGAQPQDLSVRQHERVSCDLAARVTITSAEGVKLSRLAPGSAGEFEARVVDVSRGGVGLRCAVYLPPAAQVRVRLIGENGTPALECAGRIRRALMAERTPMYYLGVEAEQRTPEFEAAMGKLMGAIRSAASAPEARRA
jgi:hypothetical protein